MSTLIDLFRTSACQWPDSPAILTPGLTLDHSHLAQVSDCVAAGLAERGILPGDRVALYCTNGPEFVYAYAGIIKAGAIVVPVNLLINQAEVAYILADAGVAAIIFHHSLGAMVEQVLPLLPQPVLGIIVGGGGEGDTDFAELCLSKAPKPEPVLVPERDLAAIIYTSGTTGFPKGAMLTHANLVANTRSVFAAMHWRSGLDRVLVVLPMFHAFAATVGMLTPLTHGCALIPLPRFEPESVAAAIQQQKATIFLGVPSMYSVLLRLKGDRVEQLASLRYGISGGAAMPVDVLRRFEARFGLPIYEGDGPTECSPVTCVNPIGGLAKPGTVGVPVPGVEMMIVGDDGKPLGDGEVGEIVVRGPNVMKGYWHQSEATAEVFLGDWFLTGDLGTRDADGYFSIVDRKKDLIIVNGMNVYPRMIEEVLYRYPGLREAAVVGEVSQLHGEVPVAYVVFDQAGDADEMTLRRYCRERLGQHQVPRRFVMLPELPKNAAGKIMKRELRKHGEIERGVLGLD
jgi:long-chain acyl-CoA synthetase